MARTYRHNKYIETRARAARRRASNRSKAARHRNREANRLVTTKGYGPRYRRTKGALSRANRRGFIAGLKKGQRGY